MLKSTKPKLPSGFTLVEILVSLTLLGMILSLGLIMSLDSYRDWNFRSLQYQLVSLMQTARSQAMNNLNQLPHGVYINAASGKVVLFAGSNFSNREQSYDLIFSGFNDIIFSGLNEENFLQSSGNAAASGTVYLEDSHTHQAAVITINNDGQIDW